LRLWVQTGSVFEVVDSIRLHIGTSVGLSRSVNEISMLTGIAEYLDREWNYVGLRNLSALLHWLAG
jgi:hypothetical protein